MERDPQVIIRELLVKIEEERRGRLQERDLRVAAESQRVAAESQRVAAESRLVAAESIANKTAFVPFLSLCYRYLFQPVTVQEETSLRSSGGLTSIESRYYPRELRPWTEFSSLHDTAFSELQELFGDQELFPSPIAISQIQRDLSPSPLADEADVRPFEVAAIELRAKDIITEYLAKRPQEVLRVVFRSNPYSLRKHDSTESSHGESQAPVRDPSPGRDPSPSPSQSPSQSRGRRQDRSARTTPSASRQARKRQASSPPPGSPVENSPKRSTSSERRMVPDRWCLAQDAQKVRRPLFTIEYKAAHKATPDILMATLDGRQCDVALFADAAEATRLSRKKRQRSKLGNVVSAEEGDVEGETTTVQEAETTVQKGGSQSRTRSPLHVSRNRTAQILTQAFHYMVESGLSYSYVSTGECLILLHVDYATDPSVLYYRLSVPKREIHLPSVGEVDEAHPGLFPVEQHSAVVAKQTPIAHVLTMILFALRNRPASFEAKDQVKKLIKVFPEAYDGTPEQQADPSQTPGGGNAPGAQQAAAQGGGRSASTVASRARPPQQSYCTQKCLRGLRFGHALDEACPNVALHRSSGSAADGHGLTHDKLVSLARAQLAANLDDGCTALDGHGKFGAVGALFKVTVYPQGYTLVAKGVQADDREYLLWEERIYQRLAGLQGTVVPVCLGVVDLRRAYVLTGGARIPCLMLLSYLGEKAGRDQVDEDKVLGLYETLIAQGVEHGDLRWANVLWNEEQQRLMVIDFDRAKIHAPSKRQCLEWDSWEWDGPLFRAD